MSGGRVRRYRRSTTEPRGAVGGEPGSRLSCPEGTQLRLPPAVPPKIDNIKLSQVKHFIIFIWFCRGFDLHFGSEEGEMCRGQFAGRAVADPFRASRWRRRAKFRTGCPEGAQLTAPPASMLTSYNVRNKPVNSLSLVVNLNPGGQSAQVVRSPIHSRASRVGDGEPSSMRAVSAQLTAPPAGAWNPGDNVLLRRHCSGLSTLQFDRSSDTHFLARVKPT
jgi:hypothetical protein